MICLDKKELQVETGPIPMKLVAVGDGAVGKTCILHRYMNDSYSEEHIPTIFENSYMMVKIDKKTVQLGIWDTAGQEEYNRLRPLSYSNTDIFLIVFSVVDPESFDNAMKKWLPELQQVQPKSLKIFVGNKVDLLSSDQYKNKTGKNAPLSSQYIRQVVKELDCEYFECSAKLGSGIKEMFFDTISKGIQFKQSKQNGEPNKRFRCTLI